AAPLFSPERNCRRERSRPIAAGPRCPALPAGHARPPARPLLPASVAAGASRSRAKETRRGEKARPIRGRCSAPLVPSLLQLRQQGRNPFPLLVGQQLLPCSHNRSSPANPPHT